MSLLTRINKTVNNSTPVKQEQRPVLIFESVRHFLENNVVVQAMRVDAREVHSALLDYHNMKTKKSLCKTELPPPLKPKCRECGIGFIIIDHRQGCEVCDHCGLVHAQGLSFLPDYEEEQREHKMSCRGIPGVPQWMIQKMYADRIDTSSFQSALEHWNHYANIPTDDLNALAYDLEDWAKEKWMPKTNTQCSHTRTARIAAALVYKDLRDKFADEYQIRNHVRDASYRFVTGESSELPEVRQEVPEPKFFCPTCNAGLHDQKSARWHCKGVQRLVGVKRGRIQIQ